jgi:hypothetical protein
VLEAVATLHSHVGGLQSEWQAGGLATAAAAAAAVLKELTPRLAELGARRDRLEIANKWATRTARRRVTQSGS